MAGHDRFVDLRPLMDKHLANRGVALGICCHPRSLHELIARDRVIVTDLHGQQLGPARHRRRVAWAGYANSDIRREIEPLLRKALSDRGY